jgi:maleylacetoacetate isomerase
MLRLYTYFRSSAAYRVRIALALKGLAYESVPVHLLRDGGEQHQGDYRAVNPSALVPALQDDGATLTQSLAILEYLEETHPQPALLPQAPLDRARVRALALVVACDIHPLNNLRVLNYLTGTLQASDAERTAWMHHWMALGLQAVEQLLAHNPQTGLFCHGDTPTLADCCLVPQVFNAQRFQVDMAPYPTVQRIAAHCESLEPFKAAHPGQQPDAC